MIDPKKINSGTRKIDLDLNLAQTELQPQPFTPAFTVALTEAEV